MATVSELNASLIDAIELMASKLDKQTTNTLTVEANIVSTMNSETGEYKVKYLDSALTAYACDTSIKYVKNDRVYILVPNGDFSQTIFILGMPAVNRFEAEASLAPSVVDVASDIATAAADIELCSCITEEKYISFENDFYKDTLQEYFDKYSILKLSCQIKTDLRESLKLGNYGLILSLTYTDAEGEVHEYQKALDNETINGDPYAQTVFTTQHVYIDDIPAGATLDTDSLSLKAFVNGFEYEDTFSESDIWIKDIRLNASTRVTEEQKKGYLITIAASNGLFLKNSAGVSCTSTTLTPTLTSNGQIVSLRNLTCYWVLRDTSVMDVSHPDFCGAAGPGWRLVSSEGFNYTVDINDVVDRNNYRCIIPYDNMAVYADVDIANLDSKFKVSVEVDGVNKVTAKSGVARAICNVTASDNKEHTYTYYWAVYNDRGELVRFESEGAAIYSVPAPELPEYSVFKCTVYEGEKYLGSGEVGFSLVQDMTARLIIENSDVLYRYDENGFSPISPQYLGNTGDRTIQPLKARIYNQYGVELNESEYEKVKFVWKLPKNSLLKFNDGFKEEEDENYYIYTTFGNNELINYSLESNYDLAKNNSSVLVTAYFNGTILQESTRISCVREGDTGTNGTTYTAVMRYNGLAYGELGGDGLPHNFVGYLGAKTVDGKQVPHTYYYDYDLKCFRDFPEGDEEAQQAFLNSAFTVDVYCNNVKLSKDQYWYELGKDTRSTAFAAEISIGDDTPYGHCVIVAEYPLDLVIWSVLSFDSYYDISIKEGVPEAPLYMDLGYNEVVYNSDGSNPKYNYTPLNFSLDGAYPYFFPMVYEATNAFDLNDNYITSLEDMLRKYPTPKAIYDNRHGQDYWMVMLTPITKAEHDYVNDYIKKAAAGTASSEETNNFTLFRQGLITERGSIAVRHCPHLHYNAFGMSTINGWDGQNIHTENGELVGLTVAAGVKDEYNQFTGVVVGRKVSSYNPAVNNKIGLFAYDKGYETIFFSAKDGEPSKIAGWSISTNSFSTSNTNAKIYSGEHSAFSSQANGFYLSHDGLSIGSKTYIAADGKITASDVNLSGNIEAGSGHIGGIEIKSGQLTATNSGDATKYWHIHSDGSAYFSNVNISGGQLNIGNNAVINANGYATFTGATFNNGVISITNNGKEKARIDKTGKAKFTEVVITGSGKNSTATTKIGNWQVLDDGKLYAPTASGGKMQLDPAGDDTYLGVIHAALDESTCSVKTTEGHYPVLGAYIKSTVEEGVKYYIPKGTTLKFEGGSSAVLSEDVSISHK